MPEREDDKTGRVDVRPECKGTFSSIEKSLTRVSESLDRMSSGVSKMGERIASQETTTQGIWHEIRNDIQPPIRGIPDAINKAVKEHHESCLAQKKLENKVTNSSSEHPRPSTAKGTSTTFGLPNAALMKWIFYFGLLIGGAFLGASGYTMVQPPPSAPAKTASP